MEAVVDKIKEYVHRSIFKYLHTDPKQLAKSPLALDIFSDLTLTCGDKEWKVHKNLLWIQSDYFRKLLNGDFKVRKRKIATRQPSLTPLQDSREKGIQSTISSLTNVTGSNRHHNRPLPRRPRSPRTPNPLLLQLRPPRHSRNRRLRNPPPHPARQNLRHSRQVQRPTPARPRPRPPLLPLRPNLHHNQRPRLRSLRARRRRAHARHAREPGRAVGALAVQRAR
jgi:hypothetical protein